MTSPIGLRIAPLEGPNLIREYARAVRASAMQWIGRGELPGQNNRGPDIDELLAIAGVGQRDAAGHSLGGPWCGVGSSAMLVLGARELQVPCPVQVHAGAKRLGRNVAAAGSFVVAPRGWTMLGGGTYGGEVDADRMGAALVAVWHRGLTRETAWSGHVEIVDWFEAETDTLWTYAPNVVPGPGARGLHGRSLAPGQAVWHQREHRSGAWRRKLYCVSSLA